MKCSTLIIFPINQKALNYMNESRSRVGARRSCRLSMRYRGPRRTGGRASGWV
jgi:hypothetical protein